MSRPHDRKPIASKTLGTLPPAAPRDEPVHLPAVVSPSLTPEQLRQAEAYASDRPLHRSPRTTSAEPPIRDPARLAEIRAELLGGEGKLVASPFLAEFGRALRAERERLGLSLSEVSELCGIEKGALSRLENGLNANPTLDTLRRYAQALGKAIGLRLADPEDGPPPSAPGDSAPAREWFLTWRRSTDRRDWSNLLAKSMFHIWVMETQFESAGGDESADLEIPADLRSDFAQLFTAYAKWMARMGPRLGYERREQLLELLQAEP
jgi:transcriptional regulator with XRE-family HTH domain